MEICSNFNCIGITLLRIKIVCLPTRSGVSNALQGSLALLLMQHLIIVIHPVFRVGTLFSETYSEGTAMWESLAAEKLDLWCECV